MINNRSKSGSAYFSVRFQISHRTIKIGAIFIAVLILAAMAVPARSLETVKDGVKLNLPEANPDLHIRPGDLKVRIPVELYEFDIQYIRLGTITIDDHTGSYAEVNVINSESLDVECQQSYLYFPNAKLFDLFSLGWNSYHHIYTVVYESSMPEGWSFDDLPVFTVVQVETGESIAGQYPGLPGFPGGFGGFPIGP